MTARTYVGIYAITSYLCVELRRVTRPATHHITDTNQVSGCLLCVCARACVFGWPAEQGLKLGEGGGKCAESKQVSIIVITMRSLAWYCSAASVLLIDV